MRTKFDARRKCMLSKLRAIPGIECTEPRGAFYAFPDISSFVGKAKPDGTVLENDVASATYLVDKGVALVPGSGFGAPGFARLSYACAMEDIEKGVDRVAAALGELS